MLYGDEKAREMARSILPSKHRKGARDDKAHARRANRHRVKQHLHTIADPADDYFDDWENFRTTRTAAHITDDAQRLTKEVVYDRRNGDKDAPVTRWAEAKADDLGDTPEARVKAIKKLLSASPMGNHALSHIEFLDEFRTKPHRFWYYPRNVVSEVAAAQARFDELCDLLRANLHRHGELNQAIKSAFKQKVLGEHSAALMSARSERYKFPLAPRLFYGAHDVEDFMRDVLSAKNSTWMRIAETGGENGAGWSYCWVGYLSPVVLGFLGVA